MNVSNQLIVAITADTHGGLEDSRIGTCRRTLALWCIAMAERLLKTRIDITFKGGR